MIPNKVLVFALSVGVGFLPTSLAAQEKIESAEELDSFLRTTYQTINGQEIGIQGAIGTIFGDQLYFVNALGRFKLELDAGREVRRQIEGCEIQMFDAEDSPCQITGMAELTTDRDDDNVGDGLEIGLILFSVDSFEIRE